MYLDLNGEAEYRFGDYKRFGKNELHVTRVCREDVMILMLDGRLSFTEDGEEVELSRGEYYIQKRGLEQSATRHSEGAYYIFFHFIGSWSDEGIHVLPKRGRFDIEKIYLYADRLCGFSKSRNSPRISVFCNFYRVLELLYGENRPIDDGRLAAEKVREFISENFSHRLEVWEVAAHFSYTADYVIRCFKRAYGITPHKYITACRIEYAKALLSSADRMVSEVAESCGYADVTTFFRAFKAIVGVSPNEWKRGASK